MLVQMLVDAIEREGLSVCDAARRYGISRSWA